MRRVLKSMNQDEDRKAGIESLAVVGILALFVALGLAAATGSWRRVAEVVVFLTVGVIVISVVASATTGTTGRRPR